MGILRRSTLASFVMLISLSGAESGVQSRAVAQTFDLQPVLELNLGLPLGQCRAAPVNLGDEEGIFLAYCEDAEIDPYVEMFFFPQHRVKLAIFTLDGRQLWQKELGPGVIPGIWFTPFFPFDLNADGADEIWFVNNVDEDHPLSLNGRRLERLDARTGAMLGQWPWPAPERNQSPSHAFRNFVLGGHVKEGPVLVTAQGTYGPMKIQAWNPDMTVRWEHQIKSDTPGARGSHMCPVVDINHDGVDEVLWGERCVELDAGRELFCGDRGTYRGHSDVIQPVLDRESGRWYIYTCRESGGVSPRVALFDDTGRRIWGDLETGHMDMGWVARLGENGEMVAMAIRIGSKTAGPQGFFRKSVEEFTYAALTGRPQKLPLSTFCTVPVDLNGDGLHELVRGIAEGDGSVVDRAGKKIGNVGGHVAMASKFMDRPGEQILCYYPDGTIRIWADRNAQDTPAARARYGHSFYRSNQKLTATGYNIINLGGI